MGLIDLRLPDVDTILEYVVEPSDLRAVRQDEIVLDTTIYLRHDSATAATRTCRLFIQARHVAGIIAKQGKCGIYPIGTYDSVPARQGTQRFKFDQGKVLVYM